MTFLLAWLPVLCSIGPQTNETIATVSYEPDIVRLIGTLHESICPGPPEYESIEKVDASKTKGFSRKTEALIWRWRESNSRP